MKRIHLSRGAALLPAVLLLCCNPVLSCYAEEATEAAESSADEQADTEETEASDSAEDDQTDTDEESSAAADENGVYTSGDYTYTILLDSDDETHKGACIQDYFGSESDLKLPDKLDGLDVIGLGDQSFREAQYLEKVTFPESLTLIGKYSFLGCLNIREFAVDTKNPVFSAQNGALYAEDGAALVRWPLAEISGKVEIPDGTTTIGNAAFACCPALTAVELPGTLEQIGYAAFSECENLTELILPEGFKEISDFAFNSCTNLKTVSFPSTLTSIGSGAFSATALEEITLPESLTYIGEQAFAATKLTEVTIPSSVQEIGYSAFGWDRSQSGEMIVNKDFLIRGTYHSSAYYYASDSEAGNHFKFELIGDVPTTAPASENQEDTGVSGLVRIIGIAVCGVLILLILAVALLTGKKNKTADGEESKNPEKSGKKSDAEESSADQSEAESEEAIDDAPAEKEDTSDDA